MINWFKRLFGSKEYLENQPQNAWNSPVKKLICKCGNDRWYGGPQGGMSTNVLCGNIECRHKYNVIIDHANEKGNLWYCLFPPDDIGLEPDRDRHPGDMINQKIANDRANLLDNN